MALPAIKWKVGFFTSWEKKKEIFTRVFHWLSYGLCSRCVAANTVSTRCSCSKWNFRQLSWAVPFAKDEYHYSKIITMNIVEHIECEYNIWYSFAETPWDRSHRCGRRFRRSRQTSNVHVHRDILRISPLFAIRMRVRTVSAILSTLALRPILMSSVSSCSSYMTPRGRLQWRSLDHTIVLGNGGTLLMRCVWQQ